MRVFIVIKVMMVVTAFSSFRVHTVRGTIRSAGCWGYPIYWANAYEYWARKAYVGIANYISAPSVSHSRHCKRCRQLHEDRAMTAVGQNMLGLYNIYTHSKAPLELQVSLHRRGWQHAGGSAGRMQKSAGCDNVDDTPVPRRCVGCTHTQ
jgi:hypothetical protein